MTSAGTSLALPQVELEAGMTMDARPRLAILDRNPHVREFLCREMQAHGFAATALRDAAELAASLASQTPPEVVVLDPEALDLKGRLAKCLAEMAARVPLVLHVFPEAEIPAGGWGAAGALVVEKQADTRELGRAVRAALTGFGGKLEGA
jgi:DNA-binding response OmpR family regulator